MPGRVLEVVVGGQQPQLLPYAQPCEQRIDGAGLRPGATRTRALGLNWYVSSEERLMFNTISVRSERRGISDNPKIFQAMLQVDL